MFPVTMDRSLPSTVAAGGAGGVNGSRYGPMPERVLAGGARNRWSVLVRERAGDVQRRQQDEDVGLQELDEELEERHDERHEPGEDPDRDVGENAGVQHQVLATGDEEHEQQVAGE